MRELLLARVLRRARDLREATRILVHEEPDAKAVWNELNEALDDLDDSAARAAQDLAATLEPAKCKHCGGVGTHVPTCATQQHGGWIDLCEMPECVAAFAKWPEGKDAPECPGTCRHNIPRGKCVDCRSAAITDGLAALRDKI